MKVYVVTEDSGLGDGLLQGIVLVTSDKDEADRKLAANKYGYFVEEHDVAPRP